MEKNDYKVSKNLDTDLQIILLDYQTYYVERSSIMNNAAKSFDILATQFECSAVPIELF